MPATSDDHVTVAMGYYNTPRSLRRAVDSILNQTHQNLSLVVVNDGDQPPWDLLDDIDDARLIRFDLPFNRGLYFALGTVLNATPSKYFVIQDSDDWSSPTRVSALRRAATTGGAIGAVSASIQYMGESKNAKHFTERPTGLHKPLTPAFEHRFNHWGLFRTDILRALGGYYAGFRLGFDSLMGNLLLLVGKIAFVDYPLYHRVVRADCSTMAKDTGQGSPARSEAIKKLAGIYAQCYRACVEPGLSRDEKCTRVREICRQFTTPQQRDELAEQSARLRQLMGSPD
jgi:glycosyltransferase involved in cell wall biosynthesis